MKRSSASPIFLCVLLVRLSCILNAAPGDLDLTFGGGTGKVTTAFFGNGDTVNDIAIQSDGRIVAVGQVNRYVNGTTPIYFGVARYNPDGSLDTSFNGSGKVTVFGSTASQSYANSVAIQSDGKVVVAGATEPSGSTSLQFALARYNIDGSLDTTFNGSGMLVTDFIGQGERVFSVAIQSDGKIVAVGDATNAVAGAGSDFALARYHADGSLDTTFNVTGTAITDFGNGSDLAFSAVLQTDGKVLVAGSSRIGSVTVFALARYNEDGTLDTSFNGTGTLRTVVGVGNSITGIAEGVLVRGDRRIVIGGRAQGSGGSGSAFGIVRYHPNGFLDLSFNGSGLVTGTGGQGIGNDLALQSDGKIVLAGTTGADFAVWRFNPNGSPDTGFGSSGKVTTSVAASGVEGAYGVAIQSDGKIVIGGGGGPSGIDSQSQFTLVRYEGVSPAPEILVEQPPGSAIEDGLATTGYGNVLTGTSLSASFTIKSVGGADLTGLGITINGTDAGDFSVTTSPTSPVPGPSGSTTFTVRFAPAFAGTKNAALHIASNDADEASFDIALTGRALAPSGDDDGDTISNEAEMNLAALGFDPLVPDAATVTLLRDNGLSAGSALQTVALHRPVLEKNLTTGNFHLSIGVETSPDLHTWTPLLNFSPTYDPVTGRIEIEFIPSPATTQFFRVLGAKP